MARSLIAISIKLLAFSLRTSLIFLQKDVMLRSFIVDEDRNSVIELTLKVIANTYNTIKLIAYTFAIVNCFYSLTISQYLMN